MTEQDTGTPRTERPRKLVCVIYVSKVAESMDDEALAELVDECRSNNERHGVTGILLYGDGCFIQAIEGEDETVRSLLESIDDDARQTDITILQDIPIKERSFGEWTMGFSNLDRLDTSQYPELERLGKVCLEPAYFETASISPLDLLLTFQRSIL